jgi:hypothetical protein
MKIKFNYKYFCAFFVLFIIEVIIAIFAKDNFIRDHLGDVFVVILIYFFIKTFIRNEIKLLWLYIFIFAVLIEISQYFHLVDLLGLGQYRVARIILGSKFDILDIVCYFAGSVAILILQMYCTNLFNKK